MKIEIKVAHKIGDHVHPDGGYLGKIVLMGIIPDDVPCLAHRGKPGYGIRYYELDPDTNEMTDELSAVAWTPIETVNRWESARAP